MQATTPRAPAQQRDLVSSLYDVATHARRFQERDPVDTGAVRLLYLVPGHGRGPAVDGRHGCPAGPVDGQPAPA